MEEQEEIIDEKNPEEEKAKHQTKNQNRNFQRKLCDVKNDVETMQEAYGREPVNILLVGDNVTKSIVTAGRECTSAGKIVVTGRGEFMKSFTRGNVQWF